MIALAFGVLGLIVGSFLNVVVLRHGAKSLGGRSACMSCGHRIRWYDNIPVFSWIALRGRCRFCKSKISIQYPLVEASTAILFGVLGSHFAGVLLFGPLAALLMLLDYMAIAALLVAISAYDFRHTIIPDEWAYSFAALAFISQFLAPLADHDLIALLLAGPIVASPLFALWLVSGGRWMGLGDPKLALGIGWLLGPVFGIFAVFLGFIIGALVSVPLVLLSSQRWKKFITEFTPTPLSQRLRLGFTMKSEIPFGPFLIVSCIIVWFLLIFGIDPIQSLGLLP